MDALGSGYVGVVRFNRERDGEWEYGFYINENVLLDRNGAVVESCWDLRYLPSMGCFVLPKQA